MKKWWIWLVVVAVAAGGIGVLFGWPAAPVTVDTVRLRPQRVEQTVTCSGVVETAENTGVALPLSCVMEQVCVEEGQQVEKGALLAVVNKAATRQLLTGQPAALLALASLEAEITAPAAGIVMGVKAQAGQVLEGGTPLAVIAPRTALQVRIAIREKDLPSLEPGMRAYITGEGFAQERYTGTLSEIAATAGNSGTGAVVEGVVTLESEQADVSWRLGLTAKAAIVVAVSEEALVVPYEAVLSDSDGKDSIYILEDGVAHRCEIKTAAQLGTGLLLADNALEGATVIIRPEKVSGDGVAVQTVEQEAE
ncbi:MAG: HlyD family efflux transporter periplasmic adaptor subunit [Clostridia bacterium]|nr:HlyD family efflux transporter periplasmic adaptor subunit [Clostridia bacterium]